MHRMIVGACLLAGILLLVPTDVTADPIVSESLRRKYNGLPPRYTPPTTKSYKYRGNTYVTPRGSVLHRYKYKSPSGRKYKGTIKSLPGGSYSHKLRRRK